jgi:hypothetical protein
MHTMTDDDDDNDDDDDDDMYCTCWFTLHHHQCLSVFPSKTIHPDSLSVYCSLDTALYIMRLCWIAQ